MLFLHAVRRAASRACCTAGSNNAIRIAMMVITTNNSISVNARDRRLALLSEHVTSISAPDKMLPRTNHPLPQTTPFVLRADSDADACQHRRFLQRSHSLHSHQSLRRRDSEASSLKHARQDRPAIRRAGRPAHLRRSQQVQRPQVIR